MIGVPEYFDDVRIPIVYRVLQWCELVLTCGLERGSRLDEHLDHVHISIAYGILERSPELTPTIRLERSARPKERLDHVHVRNVYGC